MQGYETGDYSAATSRNDVIDIGTSSTVSNEVAIQTIQLLNTLNTQLQTGIKLNYTLDDEIKRKAFAQKLESTITASKS